VKPIQEIVPSEQDESFVCFDDHMPIFDHSYHFHPEVELTLVLESEGQRLVGDHLDMFGPGDLILCGENLPHQYRNWEVGHVHSRVIQFRMDAFGAGFFDIAEFSAIGQMLERARRGLAFSDNARKRACEWIECIYDTPPGPSRFSALMECLHGLSRDPDAHELASEGFSGPVNPRRIERLQRVLNYLEEHWREPIRLDDVAKVAALHPQSLSRFFRQNLGRTFQEYLIRLRLSQAVRELLETDHSVTEIAFSCGYRNLANFNRHFRSRYGQAPREYRKFARCKGEQADRRTTVL